jgi:hypothetical protein
MTTMLSLILAFMLSIGGSPAASVNPAGCPGDTGIQAPIDNNRTINRFFEDYREKTASRPISKKIIEIPLINQPKTQIRIRFSLYLKEELRLVGYMDSMNLYQAFGMNPVNRNDPFGLFDQLHMMYYNDKKYMERLWHDNPPTWKDIDASLTNLSRWTQHSVEGGINVVLNAAQGLLHTFNSALIYGYGDRDFFYYNFDFKEGFVKRLDTRSAGRKFLGMAGVDLIEGVGTTLKAGYKLLDHNISEDERMEYERIFFNGVGAGITIGRGLYLWRKSLTSTQTSVGNYSSGTNLPVKYDPEFASIQLFGRELKIGTVSSEQMRALYDPKVKLINTDLLPTRANAEFIHSLRNAYKRLARDLMSDRAAAARLDKNYPLHPFDYYMKKYSDQGFSGEALWRRIMEGGKTPNKNVSKKYGID